VNPFNNLFQHCAWIVCGAVKGAHSGALVEVAASIAATWQQQAYKAK